MWGQYNQFQSRSEKRKRRRAYDNAYAKLKPKRFLRLPSLVRPDMSNWKWSGDNGVRRLRSFEPKESDITFMQDTTCAVSTCAVGAGQTLVVEAAAEATNQPEQVPADRPNSVESRTEILLQSSADSNDDIFDEIMRDGSDAFSDNDLWSEGGEGSESRSE